MNSVTIDSTLILKTKHLQGLNHMARAQYKYRLVTQQRYIWQNYVFWEKHIPRKCPVLEHFFSRGDIEIFVGEFKITTTATVTSLNKSFNEQNNSCARAL